MTTERFSDNPFSVVYDEDGEEVRRRGFPRLSDAEKAMVKARQRAWQLYREDGDDSLLIELGVFPEAE